VESGKNKDSKGQFVKGAKRPPTAGRRKGAKNKKTIAAAEKAKEMGIDPFELLLLFAKGDNVSLGYSKKDPIPMDLRLSATKEACSYIHPKRKSIEMDIGKMDLPNRSFAFPDPKKAK